MTSYVDSWPVARAQHHCLLCRRAIQPGETYWRQVTFDEGSAWTHKACEHCERVVVAYCRTVGEPEWVEEDALGWLRDDYPALYAAMVAGWRFPYGGLMPAARIRAALADPVTGPES